MKKRDTVLIVDDTEINRAVLRNMFEKRYNILEAENGEQALTLTRQYHEKIVVILLDLIMPVKDGYQVMEGLGKGGFLSELPVVIITADDSAESSVWAFDLGAADIIVKPFEPYVVRRRVQNIIDLNLQRMNQDELIEEQAARLRESNDIVIDALSSIIEYRSAETGQHIQRIRLLTQVLLCNVAECCPEFGLDERTIEMISSAASMHDIGKIAIPDEILNKPGPLPEDKFEIMKTHSEKGCEMLGTLDRLDDKEFIGYVYNICRYHHERWDGHGYPDGLRGNSIPVCAQVVGITDCYDALTSDRVYKKAIEPEKALSMILNGECGAFNPQLLECLKNVREIFMQLSRDYADSCAHKKERMMKEIPVLKSAMMNTMQMGQTKYLSLLRHLDSTVMEIDFNTGIYHLVYLAGNDFELLKSGDTYKTSIRSFTEAAVHPDDKEKVLRILECEMQEFFAEGMVKREWKYRVYQREFQKYCWYRMSLIRVDTDSPTQKKALLLWSELEKTGDMQIAEKVQAPQNDVLISLIGGVHCCLNDKYFTLVKMNDGILEILGYTEEEVRDRFQNRYLNLIYPVDRREVAIQLREQLKYGSHIELEYRVIAKDGRILWVLDKSNLAMDSEGREMFWSAIIDITQSKQAQEELRRTLESHRIIMDQSNDIIFEWDIEKDVVNYSSNWQKKFGYEPITIDAAKRIPTASHVHPEELPEFVGLIERMASGTSYEEIEFRIADRSGRYRWYRIRATALYNDMGKPIKAVGLLMDIDKEKRESKELQDRAEKDGLTGIYNKSAAIANIKEYLKHVSLGEQAALFILDVDDFKQINDSFGHMFGDAVLQRIAVDLKKLFRGQDIVGRIGGDEFMVLMKNIPGPETVMERGAKIIEAFRKMFQENVAKCTPACSIGISFFPKDGDDYETLFYHSDLALYEAKSKGKNRYVIYGGEKAEGVFQNLVQRMTRNTHIETTEAHNKLDNELVMRAFENLYGTEDTERAICSMLEMIGTRFNVSRVYIFESSEDGTYCDNTFEWCSEGIVPQKENHQHLLYSEMGGDYKDAFNEEGIFYCSDYQQLPEFLRRLLQHRGIRSLLQCSIYDVGVFKGWIGFDDCITQRMWTQEQIEILAFISRMLSTFLLKERAKERAQDMTENLLKVLSKQNAWIYVIDAETYELEYMNDKVNRLAPGAKLQMTCYEAFFNRTEPCEQCAVQRITEQSDEMVRIANPFLDVEVDVSVSRIRWGKKPGYLLSCYEINGNKEQIT